MSTDQLAAQQRKSAADRRPRAVRNRELQRSRPLTRRLRSRARLAALQIAAAVRPHTLSDDAIHFPFYHWVLDDERSGFARQIRELKRQGDLISLDGALALLRSEEPIRGRYFCVTFDDGLRNQCTNALPILIEEDVPAAFFVTTDMIGLDLDVDWDLIAPHYSDRTGGFRQYFEYLSWDECRELHAAGMTVGSHTCSHTQLAGLHDASAERELAESKAVIERELGAACRHFAAPFGRPHRDYLPGRDPELARKVGYDSFLTTVEGPNQCGTSPLEIRRNDVSASHGPLLFRYFIAQQEP